MRKIVLSLLVCSVALFSLPIVPLAQTRDLHRSVAGKDLDVSVFLRDMSTSELTEVDDLYSSEIKKMTAVLGKDSKKSPILIDQTGNDREFIIQAAASRIASQSREKKIYAIDWTTLFSNSTSEAEVNSAVGAILSLAEASKGNAVLYIEDVSAFSKDRPLLGKSIASQLYDAIAQGKIQIVAGTNVENFVDQIASDSRLKNRFSRIDIEDEDPFVGDKLAPDLRALVAGADLNKKVKVILQSDDINNAALRRILAGNKIQVESRATGLDMLVLEIPVRLAEEIASVRGVHHLSLDRELKTLGHIEKTTGASIARTIAQGLNISLLGTGVLNTST